MASKLAMGVPVGAPPDNNPSVGRLRTPSFQPSFKRQPARNIPCNAYIQNLARMLKRCRTCRAKTCSRRGIQPRSCHSMWHTEGPASFGDTALGKKILPERKRVMAVERGGVTDCTTRGGTQFHAAWRYVLRTQWARRAPDHRALVSHCTAPRPIRTGARTPSSRTQGLPAARALRSPAIVSSP